MFYRRLSIIQRLILIGILLAMLFQPQEKAFAVADMTVELITWNVIGLDSNNVNVGPNHFPVGARVCNTSTAGETLTDLTATFVWDSANALINLRPGTNDVLSVASLAVGDCKDFYFEVEVTRVAAAYDTTRDYHIEFAANGGALTASTPTPRTLYVEYLISQNRNSVTDMQFGTSLASLTSVPAGGTMTLMIGNTYYIRLVGSTATQGYEQIESFINFPNTIFQILSVDTTYSAESSATLNPPYDQLYGDACVWESDPNSPNYRSCLSTGKAGGNITVTYQVKILQVPSAPLVNPEPLSTLIYDFSGSSFHYNSDYGVSTRFANIVNASIVKTFSPKTINPGDTSTLTFTVNNPGGDTLTGANFVDNLPAGVSVAGTPNLNYNGCGTPSPALLSGGETSLSFSNISVAGYSTCSISLDVTASVDASYDNTSGNLLINNTDNTGSFASDTLVVSSKPAAPSSCPGSEVTLATWTMPTAGQGSGGPPPPYTTIAGDVTTATTSAALTGSGAQSIVAGGVTTNAWQITDAWIDIPGAPGVTTGPYFQFLIDTSNYGGVTVSAQYDLETSGQWAANNNNNVYIYSSTDGTNFSLASTTPATKGSWQPAATGTAVTTGVANTWFRVTATTRGNQATSSMLLDNVSIVGCPRPVDPTLSKAFSPTTIPEGSTSTLTFSLENPNTSTLTGVAFSDELPTGLLVASSPNLSTTCSFGSGSITTAAGTPTISLSGATLAASEVCTVSVDVEGVVAGQYTNISGNIESAETGANTTGTGYGTSSLTVLAPPVIAKSFTANPIFAGNTTNLTFNITNPNATTTLIGINFTDTLPAGLDVVSTSSAQCGGALFVNDNDPAQDTIEFNDGSLVAGGSCSFNVTVTGTTIGLKSNSVTVNSTNGGTGNTSTVNVLVKDPEPAISLLKQVGSTASGPWTSFLGVAVGDDVYYRFVVENVGDVPLESVNVTDPDISLASCSWTDGDGTTLVAPFTLPIADLKDNQFAICVVGPITAVSGSNPNTATASGTYTTPDPDVTETVTSTATYATPELTLDKTADESSFTAAGETLHYNYLVTNSGFVPLLGPMAVTDDKAMVTCPDVNTVGDNDDWLDVGESITCAAMYTVLAGDVTTGFVTNTATATVDGIDSNEDSLTIYQPRPDLTIAKANDTGSIASVGSPFIWTLTVSNGGTADAVFTNGQTIFSDPLPAGATYAGITITNFVSIINSDQIDCQINSGTLNCGVNGLDVTIGAGGSFTVSIGVTPNGAGDLANTATIDPDGIITEGDETNNTGSDTVSVIAPPLITKSFGAASLNLGGTTSLSFAIENPNTGTALTGVAFTDVLPAGISVADGIFDACGGANNLTTTAATGTIALTDGTIAANGSCMFNVTVTGDTVGLKNNTTGNVSSTNGGTGNTASASTTVVAPDLTIAKANDTSGSVAIGTPFTWTLTVSNDGSADAVFTNGQTILSDPLPTSATYSNLVFPPLSNLSCALTSAPAISCTASGGDFTMTPNDTFDVSVDVTPTAAGILANTATVDPNGNITEGDETNNTGSDMVTVITAAKSLVATSEDGTTGSNVSIGEIVRYRLEIGLAEGTTNTLEILENIVTNMRYLNDGTTRIAFVSDDGGTCNVTSSEAGLSGPGLCVVGDETTLSGITPTFVLPSSAITNNDGVSTTNPFPSGNDPLFSFGDVTNSDADSDSEYLVIEFNSLVGNYAANQSGNSRGNTFTVRIGGSDLIDSNNVQVTIVEPIISNIVKSVTTTPTDAADQIVYTLEFVNDWLAPAYDIVLTDALDSVLTGGTVTVAGSTTGGACGSTASTVTGSYVSPTATATVSCLNPGGTATVTITASVSDTAEAGYSFTNAASLVYTSLPGPNGTPGASNPTGSSTPGSAGTSSGERDGSDNNQTSDPDDFVASSNTVTTTLATPSLTKTINPVGTQYAIGATIPYEITLTVPEGVIYNAVLTDDIPAGLSYVSDSLSVTFGADVSSNAIPPYGNGNVSGQVLTLDFDTLTSTATSSAANRSVVIAFDVTVDNIVANQSPGTTFANSVDLVFDDPNSTGQLTLSVSAPMVSIVEPDLNIGKLPSTTAPAHNSSLTYTLTVDHDAASNAPAYDVVITDMMPVGLTGLTNINVTSDDGGGSSCAVNVDSTNSTGTTLDVRIDTIPVGCTVTITYDVTVSGVLTSTQTNDVSVTWTSLSGSVGGERDGTDGPGGAVDDYAAATSTNVTVSGPDLRLTKDDGVSEYTPGGTLTYTIQVFNDGNVTATGTVSDTFSAQFSSVLWTCVGTGGANCTSGPVNGDINDSVSIPGGEQVTYTVTAVVSLAASGNIVNTATATLGGGYTDPTNNNSATDTDTPAGVANYTITKTTTAVDAIGNGVIDHAGEIISYQVVIANTGTLAVTGINVTDSLVTLTRQADNPGNNDNTLDVGESWVYTGSYTVVQADLDNNGGGDSDIDNTAGVTSDQIATPRTSNVEVPITQNPALTIVKSSDATGTNAVGDTITYTYDVENTGNVTLTNVTVTDGHVGLSVVTCTPVQGSTLNPGDTMNCSATYTVIQMDVDAGQIDNTGVAAGTDPGGNPVTDNDPLSESVAQNPALTIVKSSDATGTNVIGDTIAYTYDVENTGNVTLMNVTVTDGHAGLSAISCTPAQGSNLNPGSTMSCSATYTVTQADLDAGRIDNTGVVTGTDPDSSPVTDNDPLSELVAQNPVLTTVKSETSTGAYGVGDTITYDIVVTNVGNVTLTGVSVTDNSATVGACTPVQPTTLAPSESMTCPASHVVTQTNVNDGSYANTATGDSDQTPPIDSTVTVDLPQTASLVLTKTGTLNDDDGTPGVSVGDTVSYTFLVENPGNVTLTNISVTDPLIATITCPSGNPIPSLGVGADETCTGSYTITQADVDAGVRNNTANASSVEDANDTDSESIPLTQNPSLTLTKLLTDNADEDSSGTVSLNDSLTFSVTMTNTGNTTLTNVSVSDAKLTPNNQTCASVAPRGTCVLTGTYVVQQADVDAGQFQNTGSVTDDSVCPGAGVGTCEETVTTSISNNPGLQVTKSMSNVTFDSPQLIQMTYSIHVENTGDVALYNLQVTDDLASTFTTAASYSVVSVLPGPFTVNPGFDGDSDANLLAGTDTLASGGSGTITLVVLADTGGKAETYRNMAIASGEPPDNDPVSDEDFADGPAFVDPAVTKAVSPDQAAVGDLVTYTITVFNNGTQPAADVVVTDTFPSNLDLVPGGVTVTPPVNASNPPDYITITAPRTVEIRLGTLGVNDVYVITVQAIVNNLGQPPIRNTVSLSTTSPTLWTGNLSSNDQATVALNMVDDPGVRVLPATGFAPDKSTKLPQQPADLMYTNLDEVWLEIPSLGIKTSIVGVPRSAGAWNVDWLGNQAGWLQGTAFPSWQGNSVVTGHVYLSNGQPGPFINLPELRWGDQVIVHAFGQRHVYEVHTNRYYMPDDLTALEHEYQAWITLITCRGYDETNDVYKYRIVTRAVLTRVEAE